MTFVAGVINLPELPTIGAEPIIGAGTTAGMADADADAEAVALASARAASIADAFFAMMEERDDRRRSSCDPVGGCVLGWDDGSDWGDGNLFDALDDWTAAVEL